MTALDAALALAQDLHVAVLVRQNLEFVARVYELDRGREKVKATLEKLNLVDVSNDLREKLAKENEKGDKASKARQKDYVKRLKIIESLRDSSNKP